MRPVVSAPDTPKAVVAYLKAGLAAHGESAVTVDTAMKAPVPIPFVRVRRIGGGPRDVILDRARLDFLVWHFDADKRADLARLVHALLLAVADDTANGVRLYSAVNFLAPIPVPDPSDSNRTVELLTVEVVARGLPV